MPFFVDFLPFFLLLGRSGVLLGTLLATYLKISRAKGANIGKLILFAKHAIENIFYVGKKTKHQKFPFIVFFGKLWDKKRT